MSSTMFLILLILYTSNILSTKAANITYCEYGGELHIDATLDHKGHIYSPGFGDEYPNSFSCFYYIKSAPGFRIRLIFHHLDIQPFEHCSKDRLAIYDGDYTTNPLIGIFCGSEPPPPIVSSGNELYMIFTADFLIGKTGFHVEYEAGPDIEPCPVGYVQCKNRRCYREQYKCNGRDDCRDGTDEENCDYPVESAQCGLNPIQPITSGGMDKVLGGIEARPGSWPWQADLQSRTAYPNGHVCGGALINRQWLITATHCIAGAVDPNGWRVHFGNHHKFLNDEGEQVRYVERIIIYPGYTGTEIVSYDYTHDFALMKLTAPVEVTDYVTPACLPPKGYELPVGTRCFATGWGESRGTGSNDVLKQTEISVQPGEECPDYLDEDTMICIRSLKENEGVCHGDSGGPLNCKIGNVWHVMGVTSFGINTNLLSYLCGLPGPGTVYNKVSHKTDWIHEMIQKYS